MIRIKHNANSLLALQQGNTSLRDYTIKFTSMTTEVNELIPSTAGHRWVHQGLIPYSSLSESLKVLKVRTITQLFQRAQVNIDMEEKDNNKLEELEPPPNFKKNLDSKRRNIVGKNLSTIFRRNTPPRLSKAHEESESQSTAIRCTKQQRSWLHITLLNQALPLVNGEIVCY